MLEMGVVEIRLHSANNQCIWNLYEGPWPYQSLVIHGAYWTYEHCTQLEENWFNEWLTKRFIT